jgi:hypothetical protein
MNKDSFMKFYRSEEGYDQLSEHDRLEIFLTIMQGSSDITAEVLRNLLEEYDIDNINITEK